MEKIKELLQQSLNIDFIAATLSNPREKDGLKKVKVRPILKKGVLLFQCEEHQNNQVFHENCDAAQAVSVLCGYMEKFRQMQMETKTVKYTVLVSKKGKVTIQKKQQTGCVKEVDLSHNRSKRYLRGRNNSSVSAGFGSHDGRRKDCQDKIRQVSSD